MGNIPLTNIDGRSTDSPSLVRTGHGDSSLNRDAMWSFVAPASRISELSIPFAWDNSAGGTGNWGTNVTMYVSITRNGDIHPSAASEYRYAANADAQRIKQTTMTANGNVGANVAIFRDLKLEKGTTYYIRVNAADDAYRSIKCFEKDVEASYKGGGGMKLYKDGVWRDAVSYVRADGRWKPTGAYYRKNGEWKEGS